MLKFAWKTRPKLVAAPPPQLLPTCYQCATYLLPRCHSSRAPPTECRCRSGRAPAHPPIPALLRELKAKAHQPGQLSLFMPEPGAQDAWPLADRVAAQQALLGASVDAHPLELVAGPIARAGAVTTVVAAARLGQTVRVAGMRQSWRRTRTTPGNHIYFMAFEDLEGMLDVVIFADVYCRHRAAFAAAGP